MTDSARIAQLVENVRVARAGQEATVDRLRGVGQGNFDSRNQQMLDAIYKVNAAEKELQQALPEGSNINQILGIVEPQTNPNKESNSQVASTGQPAAPGAGGGNKYLQNVLDAARLGNIEFNIQENALNQYDRYTYHFALYMVSDQDYERISIIQDIFTPNAVQKFILAESGVTTGFNIVDVEIKDSVSPSFRTRNTITTEMNLTITEPYGMTIIDKMFIASKRLEIRNWRFAPLILTLEIRGYDVNGIPIRNSPIKKVWKILILDFDSTLNESGSVYKITAAAHNSLAFRDQYYMLPTNLLIKVNENGTPTTVGAAPAASNAAPTTTPSAPAQSPTGATGPASGTGNGNNYAAPGSNQTESRRSQDTRAEQARLAQQNQQEGEQQASNSGAGQPNQTPPTQAPATPPAAAPAAAPPAPPPAQQATPSSQAPQVGANSNATSATRIDGSVGQFFTTLGEIITKFYRDTRGDPAAVRTTPMMVYEFQVAPSLASQMIEITNTTNARRVRFTRGSHAQEIHVNRVGISELVDDIVSSIANPRWLLVDETSGRIRVPRVESRIEHIGWDGLLNDYVKKITFYITVMETLRPIPEAAYGDRFQNNPANQLNRLKAMAEQGLHKLYPYIYSGYNTEIISFDIKFNHLHIIPMPLYGGATITPAAEGQSAERRLEDLQSEYREIESSLISGRQRIRQIDSEIQALTAQRPANGAPTIENPTTTPIIPSAPRNNDRIAALQNERANLIISASPAQERQLIIREEVAEGRNRQLIVFDAATATRYNLPYNAESAARIQQTLTAQQNQTRRQGRQFVEDVPVSERDPGRLSYVGDPRDINNNLNRSPTTADPRQNDTRSLYSTILAQMYDRVGAQLTEVELEIRGDPYWLGITNMERILELDSYIRAGGSSTSPGDNGSVPDTYASQATSDRNRSYANYFGRDAQFLLLFRAGQQPSEQTGFIDFNRASSENQSVFFNGVYNTIEVTHKFENGKFTQRLMGVRDALVNLNNLPASSPGNTAAGQGATTSSSGANATQPTQAGTASPVRPGTSGTPNVGQATPAAQVAENEPATSPPAQPSAPVQVIDIPTAPPEAWVTRPTFRSDYRGIGDRRGRFILPTTGE